MRNVKLYIYVPEIGIVEPTIYGLNRILCRNALHKRHHDFFRHFQFRKISVYNFESFLIILSIATMFIRAHLDSSFGIIFHLISRFILGKHWRKKWWNIISMKRREWMVTIHRIIGKSPVTWKFLIFVWRGNYVVLNKWFGHIRLNSIWRNMQFHGNLLWNLMLCYK